MTDSPMRHAADALTDLGDAWRESKARERAARYANGEIPATTEYGTVMSGGGVASRPNSPALDRVAPLAEWIHLQRTVNRSRVVRRRVIVIEDWEEVTGP